MARECMVRARGRTTYGSVLHPGVIGKPGLHMFRNVFVISGRGAFGLVCEAGSSINVRPPLKNMNGRTLLGDFSRLRVGALGGSFHGCCYLSE